MDSAPPDIEIVVAGDVVPGKNRRTRRYVDKTTGEWKTMGYNKPEVVKYQQQIRLTAQQAMAGRPPLSGALALSIVIARRVPASASGKKQTLMRAGAIRPTPRPDLDNLGANVNDALTGVAYYDDSQIVEHREPYGKWYGDKPGVKIRIWSLDGRSTAALL